MNAAFYKRLQLESYAENRIQKIDNGIVYLLLHNNHVAIIDIEDLETIRWHKWYLHKSYTSSAVVANYAGTRLALHRLILQPHPDQVVDHRDHNVLNNRRSNLRAATKSQNGQNRKAATVLSQSGILNVHQCNNKYWRVAIRTDEGKSISKCFPLTDEGLIQAVQCRDKMKQLYQSFYA